MSQCLSVNATLTPQNLNLDCPLPRTVQLREDHALELAQHRLSIDDRQHHAIAEQQTAQMRSRIPTFAVGPFRRVVPVRNAVSDNTLQKVVDVEKQRRLNSLTRTAAVVCCEKTPRNRFGFPLRA